MAKKYPGRRVGDKSLDKLKLAKANDRYRNDKRIDDAIFWMLSIFIRSLPILVLGAVVYAVYYYQFSDKKDTETLIGFSINIIVYFAGIVTPAINQRLRSKDMNETEE